MSAGEIIERFGFDDDEAVKIDRYAGWARAAVRHAADWRLAARGHAAGGDDERAAHAISYAAMRMEEARTWGHEIRAMIRGALRIEDVLSRLEGRGRAWGFVQIACAGETCETCERPIWHHLQSVTRQRLCPAGRRYWRTLKAWRQANGQGGTPYNDGLVREIARRP